MAAISTNYDDLYLTTGAKQFRHSIKTACLLLRLFSSSLLWSPFLTQASPVSIFKSDSCFPILGNSSDRPNWPFSSFIDYKEKFLFRIIQSYISHFLCGSHLSSMTSTLILPTTKPVIALLNAFWVHNKVTARLETKCDKSAFIKNKRSLFASAAGYPYLKLDVEPGMVMASGNQLWNHFTGNFQVFTELPGIGLSEAILCFDHTDWQYPNHFSRFGRIFFFNSPSYRDKFLRL